jgi:Replication stress response SDE2 C-terminal
MPLTCILFDALHNAHCTLCTVCIELIIVQALGMKCGGTLEQRAERLMSVKGLKPSEIDPKASFVFAVHNIHDKC